MKILHLTNRNHDYMTGAARLLVENFPHSWSSQSEADSEIRSCLESDRIGLVAVEQGEVIGFVGAMPQYGLTGWELHPLAVARQWQRQGIGRQLLAAIEAAVASRGGITLYVGCDDTQGRTSLANCDLYDDLWERVRNIRNLGDHPFEFYQKMGYQIVGVFPDVNGPGQPDIWLARRLSGL